MTTIYTNNKEYVVQVAVQFGQITMTFIKNDDESVWTEELFQLGVQTPKPEEEIDDYEALTPLQKVDGRWTSVDRNNLPTDIVTSIEPLLRQARHALTMVWEKDFI